MENNCNIIGLNGYKGSGKSTAAAALAPEFVRLSFAAPIKDMLLAMGVTPAELEDKETVIPRFGKSTRFMLQTLGTEWGRHLIDQNHWVNVARAKAEALLAEGKKVVFDDVRFDNEALLIYELGGENWRIIGRNDVVDSHVSEAGVNIELIDHTIRNERDTAHLVKMVRSWALLPERAL